MLRGVTGNTTYLGEYSREDCGQQSQLAQHCGHPFAPRGA